MAALTDTTIASTYKQLLKLTSEGVSADASAKYVEDGLGTDTALSLSTTRVGIGTASPDHTLHLTTSDTDVAMFASTATGTTGAQLLLYHDKAEPADGDRIGSIVFQGEDSADNGNSYAGIRAFAVDVSNGSEDGALSLHTQNAGTFTEAMYISETQNVGIGISTLESIGGATARLQVEGTGADTSSISLFRNTNNAFGPYLTLGKSRGGAVNADTIVADNDVLGTIAWAAADDSNRNSVGAKIFARVNGSPGDSATDMPTELVFATTADAANDSTEHMYISSAGNVGIGGASEGHSFQVTTSNANAMRLKRGGEYYDIQLTADGDLIFQHDGAADDVTFYRDGNVGIGTTSPMTTLQVNHSAADGNNGILIVNESTAVGDDTFLGGIGFDSADGNVPSDVGEASAAITCRASGTHTTSNKGGHLLFHTSADGDDDDTTTPEKMRFTSEGRLGIGDNNPSQMLSLKGSEPTMHFIHDSTEIGFIGDCQNFLTGSSPAGNSFGVRSDGDFRIGTGGNNVRIIVTSTGVLSMGDMGTNSDGIEMLQDENGGIISLSAAGTDETRRCRFYNENGQVGSIRTTSSQTNYETSSDYRLKENEVSISDGLTRINQLKPYKFNFKADKDTVLDGFFAHEVQEVVPQAVGGTKDAVDEDGEIDAQSIDQSKLVPLLVSAVQELTAKVEALENA